MKRLLPTLFLFILSLTAAAQDTCGLRITLLTCSPGEELYSTFGHTAIHVQEAATGTDIVYNYGTFPFDDPDFYMKFVRGKLPYYLSVEPFGGEWGFEDMYRKEGRGIVEQEVLLPCAQKGALLRALQENALPQNRAYRYDFIFDNCTTRAGAMIEKAAPQPVQRTRIIPADSSHAPTYRNLITEYLVRGRHPWSKLGIDLLLGARLDRRASNTGAQFLPEKLLAGFTGATAAGQPLVGPARPLVPARPQDTAWGITPGIAFGALLLLIAVLSFVPARGVRAFLRVFDFALFLLAGFVGILLLFMWFGTDHYWCANNWNLAWALPTHAVAAPFLLRERRWMNWYLLATIIIAAGVVLGWLFLPQELNVGFLPLVLLLLLRAWLIILKPHYNAPAATPEPKAALHH
ncbi:DUF4105 domain-containing protein [Flaviaesturariibacter flavus]|uniref:lipoprotein N-acyltransferase Lnb domain-containing protein n=1 Tax=Flaviaesturariibacter flavus TaxID=2502780 RepID=UPI0014044184|nr:DUF4105 domain-containing protein [Flaviaesturariibacter flavus]